MPQRLDDRVGVVGSGDQADFDVVLYDALHLFCRVLVALHAEFHSFIQLEIHVILVCRIEAELHQSLCRFFRILAHVLQSALYAGSELLGCDRVLCHEIFVHHNDAAEFVLAVAALGVDLAKDALFYERIAEGLAEEGGSDLAVLHSSNACVDFYRCQSDVFERVQAALDEKAGGNVVVGSADSVRDGNGLTFQILIALIRAVSENVDCFAALEKMSSAYELDVDTVGCRDSRLGDVADSDLDLICAYFPSWA